MGEEGAKRYEPWFKHLERTDEAKLREYAETLVCDNRIASVRIDYPEPEGTPSKELPCPIHSYSSVEDALWPPSVAAEDPDINTDGGYDDLAKTWEAYCPEGTLEST